MAGGTRIKSQAEACRAGFHNLRPCSLIKKKREIPPTSLPAGKEEDGWKGGTTGQLWLYPTFSWRPRGSAYSEALAQKNTLNKCSFSSRCPSNVLLPSSSPERMWIQAFREKPGPGCSEKTTALVSEVWAEARVETSQLLRVQEKGWSFHSAKTTLSMGTQGTRAAAELGPGAHSGKRCWES